MVENALEAHQKTCIEHQEEVKDALHDVSRAIDKFSAWRFRTLVQVMFGLFVVIAALVGVVFRYVILG